MSHGPDASPPPPDAPNADAPLSEQRRRQVTRQALSVGFATGLYGVSFGALSVAAGLSILQTQALSALLFSGGSQFAFVGIVAGGLSGAPAAIAASTLLGVRNGLYGLQVATMLGVRGPRRLAAAQLTIDESTAVAVSQPEHEAGRVGFWTTGLAVYVFWNLATLAGSLVGESLGDPRAYGLDAAAAAAFCALLWPRLRSLDAVAMAAVAALIAVLVAPHAPAGVPVLVAAVTALAAGFWGRAHHDPAPPHHWIDDDPAGDGGRGDDGAADDKRVAADKHHAAGDAHVAADAQRGPPIAPAAPPSGHPTAPPSGDPTAPPPGHPAAPPTSGMAREAPREAPREARSERESP